MNFLKDISKWVQFCTVAAVQPRYLLKKKTPLEENFNNYAKVPITPRKTKALPKRNGSHY